MTTLELLIAPLIARGSHARRTTRQRTLEVLARPAAVMGADDAWLNALSLACTVLAAHCTVVLTFSAFFRLVTWLIAPMATHQRSLAQLGAGEVSFTLEEASHCDRVATLCNLH